MESVDTIEHKKLSDITSEIKESSNTEISNVIEFRDYLLEINSIWDLSQVDFFQDLSILSDSEEWKNRAIRIQDQNLQIKLLNPEIKNGKVRMGKMQIKIYDTKNKIWVGFLNANIHPQSNKIKFSGMKKYDWVWEMWVGRKLLKNYLKIVKCFSSSNWKVDYSETTWQTKLDVAYILTKFWFQSKIQSDGNRFLLYKKDNKRYYYTLSTNKPRWESADKYSKLKDIPDTSFKYLWEVYIWWQTRYRLLEY